MKMSTSRSSVLGCAVTWALVLAALKDGDADLQAHGCDHGWTDYRDYCYIVIVAEVIADDARSMCENLGASVSSVWSPEEKNFVTFLWEFPNNQIGFMWLGLRGSDSGVWGYDDQSSVKVKLGEYDWSIFDGLSGMPTATARKCVALRNSGSIAFLDCSMGAEAFVCKKALPKVFITTSLFNRTKPVAVSPLRHVQLFERKFPPALTMLPADSSRLAEVDVSTEVGCAFRCFSVNGCQVFQVSCNTPNNCETLQCVLYSDDLIR